MRPGKASTRQLSELVTENSKEAAYRYMPPWLEWNDSEINAVEWDPTQKTKGKETTGKSTKKAPKSPGGNKLAEKDLVQVSIL